MARPNTTKALIGLIAPRLDDEFFAEHPTLEDRLAAENGFSIERVNVLHRLAGGERWKASVVDVDTSTCARTLLCWLQAEDLELFSRRALEVGGDGNGSVMTRRVLRQLHGQDVVVVVDRRLPVGAALHEGHLPPSLPDPWATVRQPAALDARIRIANAKDVADVAALRTWRSTWLNF